MIIHLTHELERLSTDNILFQRTVDVAFIELFKLFCSS